MTDNEKYRQVKNTEIKIVDLGTFLEIKFNDSNFIEIQNELDFKQTRIHNLISEKEKNLIEKYLEEIGYKAILNGSVSDKELNCYIKFETEDNKNLYIKDSVYNRLINQLYAIKNKKAVNW